MTMLIWGPLNDSFHVQENFRPDSAPCHRVSGVIAAGFKNPDSRGHLILALWKFIHLNDNVLVTVYAVNTTTTFREVLAGSRHFCLVGPFFHKYINIHLYFNKNVFYDHVGKMRLY